MKLFLGLIAACALASSAHAERWVKFMEDTTGTVYSVDLETRKRVGPALEFWTTADHTSDRTVKARETKTRWQVDCGTRKVRFLEAIQYTRAGEVLGHEKEEMLAPEWSNPIPDSIGEGLVKGACTAGSLGQ